MPPDKFAKQTGTLSAVIGLIFLVTALVGCSTIVQPLSSPTPPAATTAAPTTTSAAASPTPSATAKKITPAPSSTPAEIASTPTQGAAVHTVAPTPNPTYDPNVPDSWQYLPVIPETISDRMKQVYKEGQQEGNNRRAFSKVGDCETSSEFFLTPFDVGPENYTLEPYTDLQELLNNFRGSFERVSLAANLSFSVSSVFSSVWSDPKICGAEFPISCEYRVHRPAFALIMFGTNDVHNSPGVFEKNMRALIEYSLKNHVVPILATKADNLEGDGSINATIARLAYEYEVPLWNFWRAMQPLPNHGLKEDQTHFTYARSNFNDPEALKMGWPVRNLTALQVLDKVWRTVAEANGESY